MRLISIPAVILASTFLIPGAALACSAAGPNTHVGEVIGVDADTGSFSIMDAEKLAPVTFSAEADILAKFDDTEQVAIVEYEETEDGLKAVSVTFTQ